jgi:hypothetical protein
MILRDRVASLADIVIFRRRKRKGRLNNGRTVKMKEEIERG